MSKTYLNIKIDKTKLPRKKGPLYLKIDWDGGLLDIVSRYEMKKVEKEIDKQNKKIANIWIKNSIDKDEKHFVEWYGDWGRGYDLSFVKIKN